MKKIIFAIVLVLVVFVSLFPMKSAFADGNDPFQASFCLSPDKKGGKVGIQFTIVDQSVYGKTVEVWFQGLKNFPVNIGLRKAPGKNFFFIPENFISSSAQREYKLTNKTQFFLVRIYDWGPPEPEVDSILFAWHIPPAGDPYWEEIPICEH
jgi:hypothetical protein